VANLKKQSQFASRGPEIRGTKSEILKKEASRQNVILQNKANVEMGSHP
jgi:hypothetical protein